MVKTSRSVKIKTAKISSEESGRISTKFCTTENFLLYGITLMLLVHVYVLFTPASDMSLAKPTWTSKARAEEFAYMRNAAEKLRGIAER